MVLKTVTYLGVTIIDEDMNNSNFKSDDSLGAVFAPSNFDGEIVGEFYTTYAPIDTNNPLWNSVDINWTKRTLDATAILPFKTTFGLYGITSMGNVNLIGEQVNSTISTTQTDGTINFDLLHSACEPGLSLVTDAAGANELDIKLPMTYKNYKSIHLRGLVAEPTKKNYKAFTITGTSTGNNVNFAVGPIDIAYDADMNVDFSDIRFWIYDITVNRFLPIPHLLIKKTNSTTARYMLEMGVLNQSTVYNCLVSYGSLSATTAYWLNSPYSKRDNTYQGQLHFHTTNSDGTSASATCVTSYRNMGYDWVAPSDHNFIGTGDVGVSGVLYIPCVEYNNNSIDYGFGRIHTNLLGARTRFPYNPATAADLVTEAAAGNLTYNGSTYTHAEMRNGRITNGTFGCSTGEARVAGATIQQGIDMGHADNAFIQINHPSWYNSIRNIAYYATGYHAMSVCSATNTKTYDDEVDGMLTTYNRFNLGIEDDTHTFSAGSRSTTLVANVRNGTETSSDTTGFTVIAGTTLTSSTASYHTGTRSLKCVTPNAAAKEGFSVAVTAVAATYYFAHVWVNAPLDQAMAFEAYDVVTGTTTKAFTGTGNWQRVTLQFVAGNTTPVLRVQTTAKVSSTFYSDDFECYKNDMGEGQTAFHVYADELTENDIISNLQAGNYYVTRYDHELQLTVTVQDGSIVATSNKSGLIEMISTNGIRVSTATNTTLTYTPTINDVYIRCKVTATTGGGVAWTNPIWIEEIG